MRTQLETYMAPDNFVYNIDFDRWNRLHNRGQYIITELLLQLQKFTERLRPEPKELAQVAKAEWADEVRKCARGFREFSDKLASWLANPDFLKRGGTAMGWKKCGAVWNFYTEVMDKVMDMPIACEDKVSEIQDEFDLDAYEVGLQNAAERRAKALKEKRDAEEAAWRLNSTSNSKRVAEARRAAEKAEWDKIHASLEVYKQIARQRVMQATKDLKAAKERLKDAKEANATLALMQPPAEFEDVRKVARELWEAEQALKPAEERLKRVRAEMAPVGEPGWSGPPGFPGQEGNEGVEGPRGARGEEGPPGFDSAFPEEGWVSGYEWSMLILLNVACSAAIYKLGTEELVAEQNVIGGCCGFPMIVKYEEKAFEPSEEELAEEEGEEEVPSDDMDYEDPEVAAAHNPDNLMAGMTIGEDD
eukprot:TRINITY_DN33750_c0_g2_i2.p2 TRINITY_DN33750_c0_g2~~TRINITY_DN33750_c0_g2_i2.p2  ORF type:complete len:418 (-),score=109.43 TRINITY_DN33750_c0_g2_i2:59-1312(-)